MSSSTSLMESALSFVTEKGLAVIVMKYEAFENTTLHFV